MRRIARVFLLAGALASPLVASAEIEKFATPCEASLCFHWWPKLSVVPGWHHDRASSIQHRVNIQVPDGASFANAEAVIYGRALYKPRHPEFGSLQQLMESDRAKFLSNVPGVVIEEAAAVSTANGVDLRSITFFPPNDAADVKAGAANWERVAYGDEGDFFILFAVSAAAVPRTRRRRPPSSDSSPSTGSSNSARCAVGGGAVAP